MIAASMTRLRTAVAPVLLPLGMGIAAWALLFFPEIHAAVTVWQASDTYGHCFLILPMALYLAWDRRDALRGLGPQPLPRLAWLALPIAAVWFAAERMGIMEGRQLAAMAGLWLLVLVAVGWPLVRALLGPLLFLVFLVPFGAFITPVLQDFTAAFAIGGLNLLGIPNYATDLTIEISAGTFYVAEACAGLRFLIAAFAFGVFYALLNYRSAGRRAAFVAASIVVPIIANGLRALGIIVLGSILGSAQAAAADHIIYGWVFFSFVMLLLVAGGMPFREPPAGPAAFHPALRGPAGPRPAWAALAVIALLAVAPATAMALNRQAAPAMITALPALTTPAGCTEAGPPPSLPARKVTLSYTCGTIPVLVSIEAFPPRSTSDSLVRERRRITGELDAEEATTARMATWQVDNGVWYVVHTLKPVRSTAFANWSEGRPAQGGLSGRLLQARDSLLGSRYAPILATVSFGPDVRLAQNQQKAAEETLRRIVDAQSAFTVEVDRLSMLAAR